LGAAYHHAASALRNYFDLLKSIGPLTQANKFRELEQKIGNTQFTMRHGAGMIQAL